MPCGLKHFQTRVGPAQNWNQIIKWLESWPTDPVLAHSLAMPYTAGSAKNWLRASDWTSGYTYLSEQRRLGSRTRGTVSECERR